MLPHPTFTGTYSSAARGANPFAPPDVKGEYADCQIVPAAEAPKARWTRKSWTKIVSAIVAKECADRNVLNAAHGQKKDKYMAVCATANQQPAVRQEGTLVAKTCEAWIKEQVHERKAQTASGDYGISGAGDMEDSVFTRSMDTLVQQYDDSCDTASGKDKKTAADRAEEAKKLELATEQRRLAMGQATAKRTGGSAKKSFKPQELAAKSAETAVKAAEERERNQKRKRDLEEKRITLDQLMFEKKMEAEERAEESRQKAQDRAAAATEQAQKTTEMLLMAVTQLTSQLAKPQQ